MIVMITKAMTYKIEKLTNIGKLAGLKEDKINSCFTDEKLVDEIIKTRTLAEEKYNIN